MRIGDLFELGLIIIVMIILSPIIVPLLIYHYVRDKIDNRRFESYLAANDGATFFCYTARKTSYTYVRENILPFLPSETRIIHLADRRNEIFSLGDDIPFVQQLVWRMKETEGSYPYVSKVSNGQLVTMSINHQLYSAIKRKADADAINKKIRSFLGDEAA